MNHIIELKNIYHRYNQNIISIVLQDGKTITLPNAPESGERIGSLIKTNGKIP